MPVFKTLDIRGLSFFNAYEQASKAFRDIRKNGTLELILDKKKNFTDAFKTWARTKGYKISDMDEDNRMIRLFIQKVVPPKRKKNGTS
ncbi:MAG: hypothetical protein GWM98_18855 [Nitrospinaceae bacterium]|nr:hypothetical protein [Nitrospinaceae bacterium]NIR56164.1 hypothetical protein [Nitrospinaceae bacterium]NIS86620.1 hypothetical protein [Nitrospinaceae bacterium]NIT83453.1 hypothetical protein [Nitrospinaceae bacterium]NIU45658.1 hypothetical protein [Nitrospinaceae bacterium]